MKIFSAPAAAGLRPHFQAGPAMPIRKTAVDTVRFGDTHEPVRLSGRQLTLLKAVHGCLAEAQAEYDAQEETRKGWSAWRRFWTSGVPRPLANVAEISGYLRCSDPQGKNDPETVEKELFDLFTAGLVFAAEGQWSHRSYRVYAVSITEKGKAVVAANS